MIHKLIVKGRKIEKVDPFVFVEGGINSDQIEVLASDEWAECTSVTLQMIKQNQETYSYILAGEPVNVPQRFMQDPGKIEFALIGYDGDTVRITTERMRGCAGARVVETGADVTDVAGDPEVDEPDKWAQLINLCTGLQSSVSGIQSDVDAIEAAYFPKTGGTISGNTVVDTGAVEPNLSVKRTVDGAVHEGIVRIDSDGVLGIRHKVDDSVVNNLYLEQSKTRLSKPLDVASGGVPTNGDVGQVLKKGDSGAEWVDSLKIDDNGVLAAKSVKVADDPDQPTSGIVLETKADGTTSIHGLGNEPVDDVLVADCDPETDDSHAVNAKTMREYVGSTGNTLIGTAAGNVAHAEDSFAAKPREIRIKGRTVNNLWPVINATSDGVTVSTDDTGLVTVSGTPTQTIYANTNGHGIVANKPYTLTASEVTNASRSTWSIYVEERDADGTFIAAQSLSASRPTITFTTAANCVQLRCMIIVYAGYSANLTTRVMLVEGTEAPDFFTPTGIHGVEPEKLVVAGKNLIPQNTTIVEDRNISVKTGEPYTEVGSAVTSAFPIKENQDYIVSLSSGTLSCVAFYDMQNRYIASSQCNSGVNTVRSVSGSCFARIGIFNYASGLKVQLELGSTATAYEAPAVADVELPETDPLMDGDTLIISQDGSASVARADNTVDQLDTVTLPALPAPTFNAYMAGGYVPGEIKTEYERDVNIVIGQLEAKISDLAVQQATN